MIRNVLASINSNRSPNRCATASAIALSLLGVFSCPVLADQSTGNSLRSDVSFEEHLQQQFRFADGLPSDWIHDVLQTRDGYVWIATHNGVARYDGVRFQVFNRSNTPQLPANDTRVLYESCDGVLWIGTIGGLVRLQPGRPSRMDAIEQFAGNSVHAITEDHEGTVWIGTREETWRAKGSEFEIAPDLPRNARAICEDSDGHLWFGTTNGLYVLRSELERISHTRLPESGNTSGNIRAATINALFADEDAGLWVGSNTGLLFIKNGRVQSRGREIGRKQVYGIGRTQSGDLYLATRLGLYRSTDGKSFIKLPSLEFASCVTEDREGGLWVGHFQNFGLRRYWNRSTRTVLGEARVHCVYESSIGTLWFGSSDGLHRLSDGQFTRFGLADGLPSEKIHSVAPSRDGFWIATAGGLAKWSGAELLTADEPLVENLSVSGVFEDSRGDLWLAMAGRGGYRRTTGQTERLDQLDHGRVAWFYEDPSGTVWIGHECGLFCCKDADIQQVFEPEFASLNSSHFICHYVGRDGTLWLGTSGGIARYRAGNFDVFTSQHGLAADYIDRIVEDHHGHLWLGGRDGFFHVPLTEFDGVASGRRQQVSSHRIEQVLGPAVSPFHPKGILADSGTMWLAANRGVIKLSPEQPAESSVPAIVHIQQVRLGRNLLDANVGFEFPSGRHRLAISFSVPTFNRAQFASVKYRLDGYEADWTDAGRERVAYYTDLPPGTYTFRVAADTGLGEMSGGSAAIAFTVTPRWWQLTWLRIAAAVASMVLVLGYFRHRLRRVRRSNTALRREIDERVRAEQESREHLEQLARVSRAASMGELSTSIAHEVKQPLFAIVSNAQTARKLLDRKVPDVDEVREALDDIADDGNRASDIIDHIRALVKKEHHSISDLDLNKVAKDAATFAEPELRKRNLQLETELANELPRISGDPVELQQVILNLLLNGAQAMNDATSGQLQLRTGVEDRSVQVAVRDQGTLIDDETMSRLFEPFFTTKPDGTGMGLAINRTIIDAHGGRIWAERNDDGGLTFYFRIPVDLGRPGKDGAVETASTDQTADTRSASHAG